MRRALTTRTSKTISARCDHRTGRTRPKARTVVVKFGNYEDRELVLASAKRKQPRGFCVNKDFSQRIKARRKELLSKMLKAREEGKIAYLSFDKLVVRDHD